MNLKSPSSGARWLFGGLMVLVFAGCTNVLDAAQDRRSCLSRLSPRCAMQISTTAEAGGSVEWFSLTPFAIAHSPSRFDVGAGGTPVYLSITVQSTVGPAKLQGTLSVRGFEYPVEIVEGTATTVSVAELGALTLRLDPLSK